MTDLKLIFLILLSAFSLQHVQAAVSISDNVVLITNQAELKTAKKSS